MLLFFTGSPFHVMPQLTLLFVHINQLTEYFFAKSTLANEGNGRKVALKCLESKKENTELPSSSLERGEGICLVDYILSLIKFPRTNPKTDTASVQR